jgi:hypothetical protein
MDERNHFLCMRSSKGTQYFLTEDNKWFRTVEVYLPGTGKPYDPFGPRPPIVQVFDNEEVANTELERRRDYWKEYFPEAVFSVYSVARHLDPFSMLRCE